MTLVANWRRVLSRAWSVHILYIAGGLSALEFILQFMGESLLGRAYPIVNALTIFAALVARVTAQSSVSGGSNAGQ